MTGTSTIVCKSRKYTIKISLLTPAVERIEHAIFLYRSKFNIFAIRGAILPWYQPMIADSILQETVCKPNTSTFSFNSENKHQICFVYIWSDFKQLAAYLFMQSRLNVINTGPMMLPLWCHFANNPARSAKNGQWAWNPCRSIYSVLTD